MIRLYHPDLGREIEAADDSQAAIFRESGWVDAPEPTQREGFAPEPVTYEKTDAGVYAPVTAAKPKAVRKSTK